MRFPTSTFTREVIGILLVKTLLIVLIGRFFFSEEVAVTAVSQARQMGLSELSIETIASPTEGESD